MKSLRTHYQNLQVAENASDEVIKGAYRYLAQKWHPDRHPAEREKAEKVMRLINEAYAVLSDPIRRMEHDNWIHTQRQGTGTEQKSEVNEKSDESFSWSTVAKIAVIAAAAALGMDASGLF